MTHAGALPRFALPQMNFHGFTDSLGASTRQPDECPHCHTAVRVSNGLCLRCLLQAGLTEDEDPGSESLDVLLFEMEMMIPTGVSGTMRSSRRLGGAEWV